MSTNLDVRTARNPLRRLGAALLLVMVAFGVAAASAGAAATLSGDAPQVVLLNRAFDVKATVSSAQNPTGSVKFVLYGNGDQACAFPPVKTYDNVPLVNGVATVTGVVLTSTATHSWKLSYSGDANHAPVASGCGGAGLWTEVRDPIIATFSWTATQTVVLGTPINATVHLDDSDGPGGAVTFFLHGPNDPNCAQPPVFTKQVAVDAGAIAKSGNFTPTAAGAHRWRANYSGDKYHWEIYGTCADGATTTVSEPEPPGVPNVTIFQATSAALGEPVFAKAELTDGRDPTGTVTFRAYGPNDATCAGQPAATSTVSIVNFEATSQPFTAAQAGDYRWKATYNGDGSNTTASSPCGGVAGVSSVGKLETAVTTASTGDITIGEATATTATVEGSNLSGTVTFTLYSASDCTGVVASSADRPLTGGKATSEPLTPPSAATYYWVATYSGDAANATSRSSCFADPVQVLPAGQFARLTVTTAGTGAGTVTSDPAKLTCPGACAQMFAAWTVISLAATPAPGSRFDGWTGACSGTGACQVAMGDSAKAVTATFSQAPAGGGTGTTSGTGGTTAGTTTGTTTGTGAGGSFAGRAPSCTVRVKPARIVRQRLVVTYRCDQAARLELSGTVTRTKAKRFKIKAVRGTAKSATTGKLRLVIPAAALRARRPLTLSIRLVATNANGTGTARTNVRRLRP